MDNLCWDDELACVELAHYEIAQACPAGYSNSTTASLEYNPDITTAGAVHSQENMNPEREIQLLNLPSVRVHVPVRPNSALG